MTAVKLSAQSRPSALQGLQLSAFGMGNYTRSGLGSGSNAGIAGGLDLGIRLFDKYLPSAEVRATYPFLRGATASADDALGGVKLEREYGRYHPYLDVLAGRSQFQYADGGIANPSNTFTYTKSPSNTYAAGGGVDVYTAGPFAAKVDFQLERNSVPVTVSGHLFSERLNAGVLYRFNFNGHRYFSH